MTEQKLYLIGNAHIDPVWLWRWQEGFAEIKATFQSALDRMEEFPDFIFTSACASYYNWVEENCPEMFAKIRERIAEGRWVIAGGWWVQPDCNIPSGESLARHSLYGQRYFLAKFGRMAKSGYNVDSFGHSGALPQIFAKSGMENYVCMRPLDGENNKTTPYGPFWWESEDGSKVLTFKIPTSYGPFHSVVSDLPVEQQKMIDELIMAREAGADYMGFFGVGNHGGGPTIKNIRLIHDVQKEYNEDTIFISSPDAYFDDLRNGGAELPLYRGDLQHSASLCYSAHSETKRNNRKSEERLLAAEKFATLSYKLAGLSYPGGKIQHAWQRVMFNQFHDIICGCSIKDAYADAGESFGAALTAGGEVLNAAAQKISWAIDTMGGSPRARTKENDWYLWDDGNQGAPFVVFNPHSWEALIPAQINRDIKAVADECGNPVAAQRVRGPQMMSNGEKWNTLFMAKVPPLGYRVYQVYVKRELALTEGSGKLLAEPFALENDWFRLEVEPHTGYLKRVYDKKNGAETLRGPGAVPIVVDVRHCDTWGHQYFKFRDDVAKFADAEVALIESGPVRAKIRAISRYNQSEIRQDFILYRDRPEIEVHARLDWREKRKLLKLSFPANVTGAKAVYEIPYGYIEREADGCEEPCQRWVCSVGENGGELYGLAIVNDCKYSFDVLDNDLRMTVANSVIYADHHVDGPDPDDGLCEYLDQGVQEFKYAIAPFAGDWRDAGLAQIAGELNAEPVQIIETYHEGPLPLKFAGIGVGAVNVICAAMKRAEDGGGYVVRLHETTGRETETDIELPMLARKFAARFNKSEIKTFFIPDDARAEVTEVNLIEL